MESSFHLRAICFILQNISFFPVLVRPKFFLLVLKHFWKKTDEGGRFFILFLFPQKQMRGAGGLLPQKTGEGGRFFFIASKTEEACIL